MNTFFETTDVLGLAYAELDYEQATEVIHRWTVEGSHRMVVIAPVTSLMYSRWKADVCHAFSKADMVTSDGVPIVWARRLLGRRRASRLYGPDLMRHVMGRCEEEGVPIALLGGRPERLHGLIDEIALRHPRLSVPYAWSPPFRDLSDAEVESVAEDIAVSGAKVVFVGVGCPKQELLMSRLAPLLPCVQLGVGAAFDFIPGYVRQAPAMVQRLGLEWAFRIACEPRRLWKRYATTIPSFVWRISGQIITHHASRVLGARKVEV